MSDLNEGTHDPVKDSQAASAADPNVRSDHYLIAHVVGTCWNCRASTPLVAVVLPPGHEVLDLEDESIAMEDEGSAVGAETIAVGADANAMGAEPNAVGAEANAVGAEANAMGGEANAMGAEPNAIRDCSVAIDDDSTGRDDRSDFWISTTETAFLFYIDYLPAAVRDRLQDWAPAFRVTNSPEAPAPYWANHCERCGFLLDDHELFCEPAGAFQPETASAAGRVRLLPVEEPLEASAAGYAHQPQFFESMGGA